MAEAQGIDKLPWYTAPGLLLGIPFLLWIGTLVNRQMFYDNFVWKYYVGPVVADAAPGTSRACSRGNLVGDACSDPAGVISHAGYNMVNTLTWAVLLGLCLLGIMQIIRACRTPMSNKIVIGATLWVVVGSIWHVLEDTDLIRPPMQYLFITPPIYLLYGAFGVLALVIGTFMRRVEEEQGTESALRQLWMFLMGVTVAYMIVWAMPWDGLIIWANPLSIAGGVALSFLIIRAVTRKRGHIDPADMVVILPLGWFTAAIGFILLFLDDPWVRIGNAMPSAIYLAPMIAGLITGAIGFIASRGKGKWAAAFTNPINLLLIFSQVVDGVATALGLDMAGYVEKHVASAALIDFVRDQSIAAGWDFGATYPTFIGFVPVKLTLAMLVVYAIDISPKEDDKPMNPIMVGLVKFAIIMVGIGPGIRDFVRLAMGV